MSQPFMQFWVADYAGDTGHLSTIQHGAYLLLIMHYWARGALPTDDDQLARIVKMTRAEWAKHKPVIAGMFLDGWKHKRVEEELALANAKHEKRVSSGRAGGNAKAKAQQKASNASSNARAMLWHSPEPESDKKDTDANASAEPRDVRKDLFDKGLKTLTAISGRTPDGCRAMLGKWLKSVNDDAILVLGAIEDAERNRIADPVAWINRVLQPRKPDGKATGNGITAVIDRKLAELQRPEGPRDEMRENHPRLLSHG